MAIGVVVGMFDSFPFNVFQKKDRYHSNSSLGTVSIPLHTKFDEKTQGEQVHEDWFELEGGKGALWIKLQYENTQTKVRRRITPKSSIKAEVKNDYTFFTFFSGKLSTDARGNRPHEGQ